MDLPNRSDLYEIGREYVLQRAVRIDPKQVDVQGSDANVFVGSVSVVAFAIVRQLAYEAARLLLDSAEGEDLDRLAWDRYQQTRKGASPARVLVNCNRPTAAGGAGTIDPGSVIYTLNNVQYITDEPITFGATDLAVSGKAARAVQAGKDYQVGANYLVRWKDVPFDASIAVNNPLASAGGEDREDDDAFRNRVRNFWQAARRGTLGAIEYGAMLVDGIVSARAVEALQSDGTPAGSVTLYIADSSGLASQLQARDVYAQLEDWRAAGIPVAVSVGSPQMVQVQYQLAFNTKADQVSLTGAVLAATQGYVNSLPVNGVLSRGALSSVLQRYKSDGLLPDDCVIVLPAGDVVPDPGKSLRCSASDVTAV